MNTAFRQMTVAEVYEFTGEDLTWEQWLCLANNGYVDYVKGEVEDLQTMLAHGEIHGREFADRVHGICSFREYCTDILLYV